MEEITFSKTIKGETVTFRVELIGGTGSYDNDVIMHHNFGSDKATVRYNTEKFGGSYFVFKRGSSIAEHFGIDTSKETNMAENDYANRVLSELKILRDQLLREEYAHLICQLPERKVESTPNNERFNELKKQLDAIRLPSDYNSEDWAIAHSQKVAKDQIRKEMQAVCDHEIEEEWSYDLTSDIRKKVVRTIKCKKCGLKIVDKAEERVSDDKAWG